MPMHSGSTKQTPTLSRECRLTDVRSHYAWPACIHLDQVEGIPRRRFCLEEGECGLEKVEDRSTVPEGVMSHFA
jgi:hypothetical protein